MLRTHNDLGYKQEQRFHLELGLLKLVHAQRLLPLEALLSGQAAQPNSPDAAGGPTKSAATRASVSAGRGSAPTRVAEADSRAPAGSPFTRPSPFEADSNRKGEPKAESKLDSVGSTAAVSTRQPFAGDAAFEAGVSSSGAAATAVAIEVETAPEALREEITADSARNAILAALEDAGQNMLAHNLEEAEWSVSRLEVSAKVAMSQVLIDIALGPGPKRIIQASLNNLASKPLKFKMVSGGVATATKPVSNATPRPANGAGARSRAMNDPVVQRMQEKFGAEIRTVIDQKDRG
jgi:DNA polymerase-3 subunit gamma/tau